MGKAKDFMLEMHQEQFDKKLAKKLGISYDNLLSLGYRVDTDESEDGLIYNFIISFDNNASKAILDKINGIDGNRQVWLSYSEIESLS